MMFEVGNGDLLESDVEALVNTVNTVGVMGKGIALQFKRRYPANFKAYEQACKAGEVRLGHVWVYDLETMTNPRYVINFPTKGHWRSRSRLQDVESGLVSLKAFLRERGIRSVAIPPLGAGNGGLDWADVEPIIRGALDDMPDVRVLLFPPAEGHRTVAGQRVKMTWGRAALVRLLAGYAQRRYVVEPWEGVGGASALEIQKLMYFAQLFSPQLNLQFVQGRYGPYSERVRHLLQEMEGTFVVGGGDGSARVLDLDPVRPTDDGLRQSDALDAARAVDQEIVRPVLELIKGFEGPFGVELLASVHWASKEVGPDVGDIAEAIRLWTSRKAALFGRGPVASAISALEAKSLL